MISMVRCTMQVEALELKMQAAEAEAAEQVAMFRIQLRKAEEQLVQQKEASAKDSLEREKQYNQEMVDAKERHAQAVAEYER